MRLSLFNYKLPQNSIAQKPASPRDHSRILVYDKKTKQIWHKKFFAIGQFLRSGDVLVFNDSKVIPARLIGKKQGTGGRLELLLLKDLGQGYWQSMVGGKGQKSGLNINFAQGLTAVLEKRLSEKSWLIKFNLSGTKFQKVLVKIGKTPIPPYIKSNLKESDLREKYQTVYAKMVGSAAAPTAGLHFTKRLLKALNKKGVQLEFVTLHVGLGTFEPVVVEKIEEHKIHSEWVSVKRETMEKIIKAKKSGRRIIAVGTTSARTLEAIFQNKGSLRVLASPRFDSLESRRANASQGGPQTDIAREVNIFIYPGYKFKIIDALITNFHLPKSTLLMMVSAFIGRKKALDLYNLAIKKKYRFFSFGDAMMLY